MTERFLPSDDHAAQAGLRTPIDVVRSGETLPPDMMLGYVSKSPTYAEIRILKLGGIGEYGSEHAHLAPSVEREIGLESGFLQERRLPYLHREQPRFLWVPPAKFELFGGLIAHPDRPDEWGGQPSDVHQWMHVAKKEAYDAGHGYSYEAIADAPDEPETQVFAAHTVQRGTSDWFQRDVPAERGNLILPEVDSVPFALMAISDILQTNAEVPAGNVPGVLRFFTEAYDRYSMR